jgi:hypothetical protein
MRGQRVVLRVGEAETLGIGDPDRPGIGVGEAPRDRQRLLHHLREVLRLRQARPEHRHLGEALALLLALLAKQLGVQRQAAVRRVELVVAAPQLGLAGGKVPLRTVAIALRTAHPGVVADARHQLRRIGRLDEIVVGAGLEAARLGVGGLGAGEHHQRRVGQFRGRPEPADLVESVHPRHVQVLQDDVGAASERGGEPRIGLALGDQLHVAEARQQLPDRRLDDPLVVDEQHEHLGGRLHVDRGQRVSRR